MHNMCVLLSPRQSYATTIFFIPKTQSHEPCRSSESIHKFCRAIKTTTYESGLQSVTNHRRTHVHLPCADTYHPFAKMNLKRFVDTLVRMPAEEGTTVSPLVAYSTRSYGAERGRVEGAPVVITASFETPWTQRKSSSPTAAIVHRKGGHAKETSTKVRDNVASTTPTILASNPIAQFLQPDDVGRARSLAKGGDGHGRKPKATVVGAKTKANTKAPLSLRRKGKPVVIPAITQNLWSLRAIAPLIQWLQHHRVRYAYADWECQHTNGTRTRTVSQHGVVVEDREAATQAEYVCEASFGQNLYVRTCRTAYVPGSVSTYNWWSDVKAGAVTPLSGGGTKHVPMAFSVRPSEREHSSGGRGHNKGQAKAREAADGGTNGDAVPVAAAADSTATAPDSMSTNPDALKTSVLSYAEAGVYSQVRQHRVYRWDRATSVHLSTTNDGQGYRVWLEHCVENTELQKEFRKLMVVLAYHLSFHTS